VRQQQRIATGHVTNDFELFITMLVKRAEGLQNSCKSIQPELNCARRFVPFLTLALIA
jgi:hypothetical protein